MNDRLPEKLKLLDPTAPSSVPGAGISPRLHGIEGRKIGMLDNGKPNFDLLLATLEELLLVRYSPASVTRRRKPTVAAAAPQGMREELLGCDSIITGLGDWGSCTSWSIHDAVEFEKAGVPTVTICSREFYSLGRMESETLGMPSLPIVMVPHPFGSLERQRVREEAGNVVEEVVKALTARPEGR